MDAHTPHILFIEDDKSGRELGIFNLTRAGYAVDGAASGEEGLRLFSPTRHHVVVTDLKMPGISGLEVLGRLHRDHPDLPVIVITAFGSVDAAVAAMREGAYDFIPKPFNKDQLVFTIARALQKTALSREVHSLRIRATGVERPIVWRSDAMERQIRACDRFAASDASVLITGESGTGKELFARRLHVLSRRAEGPFVAINCAAIPEALLESELFGHAKGAFTGAHQSRRGKFRQADGGTLFLDEIGEIPTALQSKILRAIEEREVQGVGEEKPHAVDIRLVSATNRDLQVAISEGRFREDLYYRLNVVELSLPPLRERSEDIPALAEHFVREISTGRRLEIPGALMNRLTAYHWPGNIRELANVCERLVLLCADDTLSEEDLPAWGSPSEDPKNADGFYSDYFTGGRTLLDLEQAVIQWALARRDANVTRAAELLGVPRHFLAYRMEKYGICRTPQGEGPQP